MDRIINAEIFKPRGRGEGWREEEEVGKHRRTLLIVSVPAKTFTILEDQTNALNVWKLDILFLEYLGAEMFIIFLHTSRSLEPRSVSRQSKCKSNKNILLILNYNSTTITQAVNSNYPKNCFLEPDWCRKMPLYAGGEEQ